MVLDAITPVKRDPTWRCVMAPTDRNGVYNKLTAVFQSFIVYFIRNQSLKVASTWLWALTFETKSVTSSTWLACVAQVCVKLWPDLSLLTSIPTQLCPEKLKCKATHTEKKSTRVAYDNYMKLASGNTCTFSTFLWQCTS